VRHELNGYAARRDIERKVENGVLSNGGQEKKFRNAGCKMLDLPAKYLYDSWKLAYSFT